MKIIFYEIEDWEAKYIGQQLAGFDLEFNKVPLPASPKDADIISPFVGSRMDAKTLQSLPSLKLVATRSTGFDHIHLEAARAHGVVVSNVPVYGENTVAEFAFALLLTLSRKIYPSVHRIREQGRFSFEGLRGFDLKGKTLGVVGTGHIGANVIQIAGGFGMKILASDPFPNAALARKYKFKYVSLEALLQSSDVITLHAPYGPSTHHLLNSSNMRNLKPGSVLINTARGALVETKALVAALHSGVLAGAALDVLEEEGYINDEAALVASSHPNEERLRTLLADHALSSMENVIITPHNAFNTVEAIERILDTTAENIKAFVAGKPINIVTH